MMVISFLVIQYLLSADKLVTPEITRSSSITSILSSNASRTLQLAGSNAESFADETELLFCRQAPRHICFAASSRRTITS